MSYQDVMGWYVDPDDPPAPAAPGACQGCKFLMIEDDADTAEIVCSEFREHGYDIAHESDGREGLRRAVMVERIGEIDRFTSVADVVDNLHKTG